MCTARRVGGERCDVTWQQRQHRAQAAPFRRRRALAGCLVHSSGVARAELRTAIGHPH